MVRKGGTPQKQPEVDKPELEVGLVKFSKQKMKDENKDLIIKMIKNEGIKFDEVMNMCDDRVIVSIAIL